VPASLIPEASLPVHREMEHSKPQPMSAASSRSANFSHSSSLTPLADRMRSRDGCASAKHLRGPQEADQSVVVDVHFQPRADKSGRHRVKHPPHSDRSRTGDGGAHQREVRRLELWQGLHLGKLKRHLGTAAGITATDDLRQERLVSGDMLEVARAAQIKRFPQRRRRHRSRPGRLEGRHMIRIFLMRLASEVFPRMPRRRRPTGLVRPRCGHRPGALCRVLG
jgi:hypothetical protein